MIKANCIRPCQFMYGSCEKGWIIVHPSYLKRNDLLKDQNNNLFCHNGRLLTVYDKICEKCGEELEFSEEIKEKKLHIYTCKKCERKIEMEVI